MSELYRYVDEHPNAAPMRKTCNTWRLVIESLNKAFLVMTMLKSIDDGLKFFTNWIDQIIENGTNMFVS